jgi:predicted O-methyltransferase YrrM
MLTRFDDWYKFLNVSDKATLRGKSLALDTLAPSAGMMVQADLDALAAALLHLRPDRIFEIGTYMGESSNFFLSLLPKVKVISIAYIPPEQLENPIKYNNIELGLDKV